MTASWSDETGTVAGKVLAAFCVLLVLLLLAGFLVVQRVSRPVTLGADGLTIEIAPGSGAASIADTLEREGVIASALWFRLLVARESADGRLRAGAYTFEGRVAPADVLSDLLTGPPSRDIQVTMAHQMLRSRPLMEKLVQAVARIKENAADVKKALT